MVNDTWLTKSEIPSTQVFPIPGEVGNIKAAEQYENIIIKVEKFDLVLLFGIMHHLENRELDNILLISKKGLKKNGKLITCDPVFIKKQNFIANFLIKNDAGNNVRNKNSYLKLLSKNFKNVKYKIKKQIFIPYTWFSTLSKK